MPNYTESNPTHTAEEQLRKEVEDLKRQLRELKAKGLERVLVLVSGWPHLGYDRQHPDSLPPPEQAGGWNGMKQLIDTCREIGYPVVFHDQYRDYYLDAPSYN